MTDLFFEKLSTVCHNLLLENENHLSYLKNKRGMTDDTIKEFKLGAFPKDLRDLFEKHNLDAKELRERGIIINANKSPFIIYPIVIPIQNTNGNCIAIGCRTLYDEEKRRQIGIPKYRNSVYKKTMYLYGLNKAIKHIREKDRVFVVEGYFDAISAHQNGFKNVVATCGTIFSEKQLIILSRYTNNICLLFDNDEAGRNSSKKIIEKLNNLYKEVNLTCAFTPEGYKDLDEYLHRGGSINMFEKGEQNGLDINRLW